MYVKPVSLSLAFVTKLSRDSCSYSWQKAPMFTAKPSDTHTHTHTHIHSLEKIELL